MTEPTLMKIADVRQTSCGGELRWVPKSAIGMELKLQQLWITRVFQGGYQVGIEREWRDIPTVRE